MSTSSIYDYSTSTVQQRAEEAKNAAYGTSTTDFLQLLIAQLTNQDPLSPMEDMDFTSQLAQLQALEEQMAMTKSINAMRMDAQVQAATALIGKEVSGYDRYGAEASGVVVRVIQTSDDVYVELENGQQLSYSSIYNINDSTQEGIAGDLASAANYIGMWVEAYDDSGNVVKGIVQTAYIDNGKVMLQLYGGQSISFDSVGLMRGITEADALYLLPDSVREDAELAQTMYGMVITGTSTDGETVTGIVASAVIGEDNKVYLIFFDGTLVEVNEITDGPNEPTVEDIARDLAGLWAIGLDEDGNRVEGLIVGAEEWEDGIVLLLEDGRYLYFDALLELADPPESEDTGDTGDTGDDGDTGGVGGVGDVGDGDDDGVGDTGEVPPAGDGDEG